MWRARLRATWKIESVWQAIESPTSDYNTDITKAVQTVYRQTATLGKALGMIISGLGDAALRIVLEFEDDSARMLKLLDSRYSSSRTVSRIAVQTQLFRVSYKDQNMSSYIDHYASLFSQFERMRSGDVIPESHKAPMLLASIDPSCCLESTAAVLRTKDPKGLTWDYVGTTLIDEYNARRLLG